MEQSQSDKIREKLYDLETPVNPEVWQGIEGSLRRRKLRRLFTYASSAAAVLVAALLVLWPAERASEDAMRLTVHAVEVPDNLPRNDVQAGGAILAGENLQAGGNVQDASAVLGDKAVAVAQAAHIGAAPSGEAEAQVKTDAAEEMAADDKPVQVRVEKAAEEAGVQVKADNPADAGEKENVKEDTAADRNLEGYLAALEDEGGNGGRKYSVAFSSGVIPGSSASVSGSTIKASSAGAGAISQNYSIEQISDTRYSLPLNLGIQFQFALKENLAVGVGVNYTLLRSRYDCLINKKQFEVTQTLHYVGVPVNVYGLISERNRFSFYVNAGAMFEKGIRAVYDLKSYNQKEHSTLSISGVDVSVNAGLGVEYRPGNLVGLYFEPNLVYFFNSDVPRSIRTDQPLQVKAELGCRFHF